MVKSVEPSRLPFGQALGEVLRSRGYVTRSGNVNWHGFANEKLDGQIHYESLRKAVANERQPTQRLMKLVAEALEIDPSYFAEYRIAEVARLFNVSEVGFDRALKSLDRLARSTR